MAAETFPCPGCGAALRNNPSLQPGDLVQCPRCRTQFPVPEESAVPLPANPAPPSEPPNYAPEPEPLYRPKLTEIEEEPRRGRDEFDFGDEDEVYPAEDDFGRETPPSLPREYELDLGRWFSCASAHFGALLGPAIGYLILLFIIQIVAANLPCIGLLISVLVVPPLQAGMAIVCLRQLQGKRWTFSDFFNGFHWWGALVVTNILVGLITLVCLLPGFVMGMVASEARNGSPGAVLIAAALIALGAFVVLRASLFTTQMIVDRNCGPSEAIQQSWALTRGHFLGWLGVTLLLGLINVVGVLLLGVGLLFTIPFTALVLNAGYLFVAGRRPPLESNREYEED